PRRERPDQPAGRGDLRAPVSRCWQAGKHCDAGHRQRPERRLENCPMNLPVTVRRLEPLPNHIVTEDYAATEFVERHGQDLRYCHTTGSWFVCRTTHWQEDEIGEVFQMARVLARQLSEYQNPK